MSHLIGEILLQSGDITPDQLSEALAWQVLYGGRLGSNLLELELVSEEALARALGKKHGCEFVFGELGLSGVMIQMVPAVLARRHELFPWRVEERRLKVVVADPSSSLEMLDELSFRAGKPVKVVVAPEFRVHQILRRHFDSTLQMRALDFGQKVQRKLPETKKGSPAPTEDVPDLMDDEQFAALYSDAMHGGRGGAHPFLDPSSSNRDPSSPNSPQSALGPPSALLGGQAQTEASQQRLRDGQENRGDPASDVEREARPEPRFQVQGSTSAQQRQQEQKAHSEPPTPAQKPRPALHFETPVIGLEQPHQARASQSKPLVRSPNASSFSQLRDSRTHAEARPEAEVTSGSKDSSRARADSESKDLAAQRRESVSAPLPDSPGHAGSKEASDLEKAPTKPAVLVQERPSRISFATDVPPVRAKTRSGTSHSQSPQRKAGETGRQASFSVEAPSFELEKPQGSTSSGLQSKPETFETLEWVEGELIGEDGEEFAEPGGEANKVAQSWAAAFQALEKSQQTAVRSDDWRLDDSPLSFQEALKSISNAESRDEVARAVLRYARSRAARAILLGLQGNMALGWDAVGEELSSETARRIAVPLSSPSVFRLVRDSRSHYLGPLGTEAGNVQFLKEAGKEWPSSALLLPVLYGGRVVYVLYVDNGHRKHLNTDLGELLILAQSISRSLETLVSRKAALSP